MRDIRRGWYDKRLFRWDNAVLIIEYIALACILGLTVAVLGTLAQAASLEISGNSTGTGSHVMEIEGVSIQNMTTQEAIYVLGPGHNMNITRNGLVTFENGSQWQVRA